VESGDNKVLIVTMTIVTMTIVCMTDHVHELYSNDGTNTLEIND
jgi:hypothetical protein